MIGASFALALGAVPDPAEACRPSQSAKHLFHRSLAPLLDGGIVAYVKILKIEGSGEMTARIISVLRGNFTGTGMTINIGAITSCDSTARVGDVGVVAGKVLSSDDGHIVLEALMAAEDPYVRIFDEPFSLSLEE